MTDTEALLEALEALHYCEALNRDADERKMQAITVIRKLWTDHAMREVQRLGQEIEQEPVAWQWLGSAHFRKKLPKNADITAWNPLYTTPPQRTWVNLTDEDRNDCLVEADPCECLATPEAQELMRCVEAKSKEKNT